VYFLKIERFDRLFSSQHNTQQGSIVMMSQAFQNRLFWILPHVRKMFGTPFHIYDETGILGTIGHMKQRFAGVQGYQNFYAVKALPNPTIQRIMFNAGFGFDCSSIPELMLARQAGARADRIMFTSNNTSQAEFREALGSGGCILNLDDITLIDKVPGKFPEFICFRYNPGNRRTGNSIIGKPAEAKYGVAHHQIVEAYRLAKKRGAKRFGLHTMLCSNERDYQYMVKTVDSLLKLAAHISKELKIRFEFVNIGGGIGIPYHPDHNEFDLVSLGSETARLVDAFRKKYAWAPAVVTESGRYVTGPHGALVTSVINHKHTYREYVGVDASMSALMRPGMYGAYHHAYVVDQNGNLKRGHTKKVSVVGPICENCDQFAQGRRLPIMHTGDFYVIANTGAHAIAMGFNYNGRLRPQELLLTRDGRVELIGRAETIEDLFARYQCQPKSVRIIGKS